MKKVYFISVDKIKEKSLINANTDEKIIKSALLEVQELELEPLIGDLYSTLETQLTDDTLTDDNRAILVDVIQPYLIYGTLVYSVIPLHYKLGNAGASKSTDTNLTILDSKELASFQGYYEGKFESYKRRLIEHFACDGNNETNISIEADTTSTVLNFYLPDVTDRSKEISESRAYKTGWNRW